eukprot:6201585-Pleurochrysis_carterae.AAC.1
MAVRLSSASTGLKDALFGCGNARAPCACDVQGCLPRAVTEARGAAGNARGHAHIDARRRRHGQVGGGKKRYVMWREKGVQEDENERARKKTKSMNTEKCERGRKEEREDKAENAEERRGRGGKGRELEREVE